TFSATGLPSGLSISASGTVSGTPTTAVDLTNTGFTAHVVDSSGASLYKGIGIRINPAVDNAQPSISVSVAPYGNNGGNVYTITASATDASGISEIRIYLAQGSIGGHGAYTMVESCSSSPCTYTSGDNSGSYVYYATATDASANHNIATSEVKTFMLPFDAQSLVVTTPSLPDGTVGMPYSYALSASGGTPPYSWALVQGGALFAGLSINSSGQVLGTPINSGVGLVTVRVTDSASRTTDKALSLRINSNGTPSSFIITTESLPNGAVGQQYAATIGVSGTAMVSSWSIPSGALPPGLSLDGGESSATILGTPNATGTYSFKVQVRENGTSRVAEKVYILTVSSQSNGGGSNGGTGSAGGSVGGLYRTSTKVTVSCAGKESKISVRYLIPTAPAALVEIAYVEGNANSKVFSRRVSSTTELSFVPEKPGAYELRVSIDTTQSTSSFLVPACGLSTTGPTGGATVDLSPRRELVSTRTVNYGAGFSKVFKVYRATSGGVSSYSTEITMTYSNSGAARQNFSIADSVPKEVISSVDQIIFENSPSARESQPLPRFSWNVRSISSGGNVSYAYRLERPLTDQMIDKFASPRILAPGEAIKVTAGESGSATSDLLAASIGFAGFSVPFSTLLVAAGGAVLLALILLFVFGRKKDEE
ncbi:MAG: Ig domain-containing protein, partial [Candidatus Micrarchaeia archaeon]